MRNTIEELQTWLGENEMRRQRGGYVEETGMYVVTLWEWNRGTQSCAETLEGAILQALDTKIREAEFRAHVKVEMNAQGETP